VSPLGFSAAAAAAAADQHHPPATRTPPPRLHSCTKRGQKEEKLR